MKVNKPVNSRARIHSFGFVAGIKVNCPTYLKVVGLQFRSFKLLRCIIKLSSSKRALNRISLITRCSAILRLCNCVLNLYTFNYKVIYKLFLIGVGTINKWSNNICAATSFHQLSALLCPSRKTLFKLCRISIRYFRNFFCRSYHVIFKGNHVAVG